MSSIQMLDNSAKLIDDLVMERSTVRIENEENPISNDAKFYKEKRRFCVDIESSLKDFDFEQNEILNSTIDIGYKLKTPQIFIASRTSNKIKGLIAVS